MRRVKILLALIALTLSACATARIVPVATEEDVEKVREEERAVDEAQAEKFTEYLLQHPGDTEGATAAAFGVAMTTRDAQLENREDESGDSLSLEEIMLIIFGGGAIGTAATRALRGPPEPKRKMAQIPAQSPPAASKQPTV